MVAPESALMNDEFLHRLRTQPSPAFAVRLKSKLDEQEHSSRLHRLLKLCVVMLLLGGGTALALVSTSARNIVVTVVEHLSNAPPPANKTQSNDARVDSSFIAPGENPGPRDTSVLHKMQPPSDVVVEDPTSK